MIPIYVKTVYSFLSSLITIDDLIVFAKKNDFHTLCICDDNMYGVMEFIRKCESNNIKPVIGLDLGFCLLYAKNYDGYQNLLKITSLKSEKELEITDIKDFSSNLICLINYQFVDKEQLINLFPDYYLYSLDNNSEYLPLRKTLCLDKKDLEALKCLMMLRDNKTYSSDYEFDTNVVYSSISDDRYQEILDKCGLSLPKYELNLPDYCKYNDTKGLNSDDYLYNLAIIGLNKRLDNKVTIKYKDRLLHELEIIKKMGYSNYFLIVYDFIRYAKSNNILVGPGRGSAVGSLVCYSLGITDIDPMKYDLLFERFLNPERVTMPDIDTDFPDEDREKIIHYVQNKYGMDNVSLIVTFGTFGSKMAIRDLGRVMNIPLYTIDDLCKKIGDLDLSIALKRDDIKNIINSDNRLKKLLEITLRIVGIPRHSSIHAAGVIMANTSLKDIVPLVKNGDVYVSGYEALYLENLGLLKMDFLSLTNLTMITKTLDLINTYTHKNIRFNDIPLDDKLTNEIFQKGDTLGIFQFESMGMRDFLIRLHPDNFEDIYNANAFYRPGPSSQIDLFIKRKNNLVKIDYYDDSFKDILKSTKGIIVYQEQIIQIANKMASFSMGEADLLRRAMSKKKVVELEKYQDKFIGNAINNGYSRELSEKIYHLILNFASYGFNKSHSVAYSVISYKMAYLKAHYPIYFYLAILDSKKKDDKILSYIKEMKKHQIKISKPDINKSMNTYTIYYDSVILPFNVIKGISSVIENKIIEVRKDGFTDIYDFFVKVSSEGIGKGIINLLIDSGCLDSFNYTRKTLYANLDNLINYANLVSDLGIDYVLKPEIIIEDEFDKDILINNEKNSFGFYLSNHPVSFYREKISNTINLADIKKYYNKNISCIVMIDRIKEITTKKGEKMAFLTCSDEETSIDVIVFPKVYENLSNISKNAIIKVDGKVERRSDFQIIANNIVNVKEIV